MFKFRPHRGSLSEAMGSVVELETIADLTAHIASELDMAATPELTVKPYGYDARIDWDSHIVSVEGYGVVGFTDAMPPQSTPTPHNSPRP